jgi:predicted transcriptional regulator of viral defense system
MKSFDNPSDLPGWINLKQSQGSYFFTREEALKELKINAIAFRQAVVRLTEKNRIIRVHGGFYVIIPLEYAASGILPAEWFIDDLMRYVGQPYYVGLLSAAILHGAAHQQPQQYQVVTNKPIREARLKSLALRFFVKKGLSHTPVTRIKVQTGFIVVSTPEATALDLVRYSRAIGGLDRVITVLQELGEVIHADKLIEAVQSDGNVTYVQRLGWLLEKAGYSDLTEDLAKWISQSMPFPAKLDPSLPIRGATQDTRWNLLLNAFVESDL